MKWLDDSEAQIWREKCLVEVHTGMDDQECWRGTYKSKNKGHWRKVWESWEETACPWISTPQNQIHRGGWIEKVESWPPSAPTNLCWWEQWYIVMSKTPTLPLAGGVPSWPIRLKGVAPHCSEKVYIGRSEAEILGYAISCYHLKVTRKPRQSRRVPMWYPTRVKGRKKTLCPQRYRGSVKVRWFHLCSPRSPLTLLPKTSTLPLPATKALISPHPFSWNLPSHSDVIPFHQI